LRQAIEAQGLQERITLTGWVTPEEVLDWFDKSDILFMPSLSEGLPVVGVQALAKGLAVVASRIGGFVDIVEQGRNGFLVEGTDLDGFGNALRDLLSNRERLRKSRLTSLDKAKGFDIQRITAQYERLFQEIPHEH
jgi:glycosyltransferase involved in cell wall biosynthesis